MNTFSENLADGSTEMLQASRLYLQGNVRELDACLDAVSAHQIRESFLRFIDLAEKNFSRDESLLIIRHIGQHPHFSSLVVDYPHYWRQALFFANLPFLKTRVSMSFFNHPKISSNPIDYDIMIFDQNGKQVLGKVGTLSAGQTHNFEIAELLSDNPETRFGTFVMNTVEKDLGSLRIFAYWYNESSMTTTHEKGALTNPNNLMIYPTVISDKTHETYLAVSNTTAENPLNLIVQVANCENERHPNSLNIGIPMLSSALIPLSQHLKDLEIFLKGKPGALYLTNDQPKGIYYYFIHNKELNTWQIQHV